MKNKKDILLRLNEFPKAEVDDDFRTGLYMKIIASESDPDMLTKLLDVTSVKNNKILVDAIRSKLILLNAYIEPITGNDFTGDRNEGFLKGIFDQYRRYLVPAFALIIALLIISYFVFKN